MGWSMKPGARAAEGCRVGGADLCPYTSPQGLRRCIGVKGKRCRKARRPPGDGEARLELISTECTIRTRGRWLRPAAWLTKDTRVVMFFSRPRFPFPVSLDGDGWSRSPGRWTTGPAGGGCLGKLRAWVVATRCYVAGLSVFVYNLAIPRMTFTRHCSLQKARAGKQGQLY